MFNLLLHLANEKKLEIQPLGTGDLDIIPLGEEDDILNMLTQDSQDKQNNKRTRANNKSKPSSKSSSKTTASTSVNSKTPTPPLIESNTKF